MTVESAHSGRGEAAGTGGWAPPPRQRPYDEALRVGFDALRRRPPDPAGLAALGARADGATLALTVLGRRCTVVPSRDEVWFGEGGRARVFWAVLVVHYLCAVDTRPDGREVSFAHFTDCGSYLSVFGKRIVGRFLATSGRTAETFGRLAAQAGGTRLPPPGDRFRFDVLPRVPIAIMRYEGDDEVAAGASVVYRADAAWLLPAEDRVVAAELLLDALAGKPMTENGGAHAQGT